MNTSVSGILKKEVISQRNIIAAIGVLSFVLFCALGAHVYIPLYFTPVPLTMQTFFVLAAGATLGKRLGSLSQALYLLLGATGCPLFFSGGWGLAHIAGPTGGYVAGFVFAAYAIGSILEKNESILRLTAAFVAGELIILFCGAAWLIAGYHLSLRQAFVLGVAPFIAGDAIKLAAAVFICAPYLKRARSLFY